MAWIDDLIDALEAMPAERAEVSETLDHQRCVSAHAVMVEVAEQVKSLPRRNVAGMFPRVTVAEHGDMHILITAMTAYGDKLKREFLEAASRYAMGSNELPWEAIQGLAAEYVAGARLAAALDVAHQIHLETNVT